MKPAIPVSIGTAQQSQVRTDSVAVARGLFGRRELTW